MSFLPISRGSPTSIIHATCSEDAMNVETSFSPRFAVIEPHDAMVHHQHNQLHSVVNKIKEYEGKVSRLANDNSTLKISIESLSESIINLNQAVESLSTMYENQQKQLFDIQDRITVDKFVTGMQRKSLTGSGRSSQPSISLTMKENDKLEIDVAQSPEQIMKDQSVGLYEIRQKIPRKLNSGYVIHSLLCCAMNGLGAFLKKDSQGRVEAIRVTSYWLVKACCIYIIKHILCKKSKSSDATAWDKSLKQHWFDGWVSRDEFLAHPKRGKCDALNELLVGHYPMTEGEKKALLERVDVQPQF